MTEPLKQRSLMEVARQRKAEKAALEAAAIPPDQPPRPPMTPDGRIIPKGGSSTAQPKKPHPPQGPQPSEASIVYKCGHHTPVKAMQNQDCPTCVTKNRESRIARKQDKRNRDKQLERATDDSGRLPHESRFAVVYDAVEKKWSGILEIVEGDHLKIFSDKASGVFRLLYLLDMRYRRWLHDLKHPSTEKGKKE